MKVLLVASEAAPLINTSGVANVVTELCLQLRRERCDARLVIPRYRSLQLPGPQVPVIRDLHVPMGPTSSKATLTRIDYRMTFDTETSVPAYLVDDPFYFDRENAFGYPDDYERFIFFTRAILEALRHDDFRTEAWVPDVIHCHDWVAGLIPLWVRGIYQSDPVIGRMATVFTIHNVGFPGKFSSRSIALAGLGGLGVFKTTGENRHTINFMGRGILGADAVNTVSPQHARDLQSGALGEDLRSMIDARQDPVVGILNGVDEALYSPFLDRAIAANFGSPNLPDRKLNKADLQRRCEIEENPDIPVFGMVSRLIAEKGTGLVEDVLPEFLEADRLQFVVLGQPGDFRSRESLARMQTRFARNMRAFFAYDDALARRIFAGSDVIMKPSLSEPCGLQQMLAMRYGALPLVRKTGGLADTVGHWSLTPTPGRGSGFVFDTFDAAGLRGAIREAVDLFHADKDKWRDLQRHNMRVDFSWSGPAASYTGLYCQALAAAANRGALPSGVPLKPDPTELLLQTLLAANELPDTHSTQEYLRHTAESARALFGFDALLIWSVDAAEPQWLTLSAATPASVWPGSPAIRQEHSNRSWSRQNVFELNHVETLATGEFPAAALKDQLGFLESDLARGQGWRTQLTVPIGASGTIGGRIDVFSKNHARKFAESEITALTAIGAAIAVNLRRRQLHDQDEKLLEASRRMADTRSTADLARTILEFAGGVCYADIVVLRLPGRYYVLNSGAVIEKTGNTFRLDRIHNSYRTPIGDYGEDARELEVARSHGLPFSREHENALRRLALQAAPALDAALRREKDEHARAEQLKALADSLLAGGDFENLLTQVTRTTAEVLQAQAASLYLVDESADRIEIRAAYGYHEPILVHHRTVAKVLYKRGEGTTGWLWERGQKFKADSRKELYDNTPHRGLYKSLQHHREPDAFMGLPLKIRDQASNTERVIGVLKVEDRHQTDGARTAFTEEEFVLAEMMANIIATVLYNVQVSGAQFQKLSRDLEELSKALAGAQDIDDLVKAVVTTMAATLNADASSVYLYNESNGLLEIRAATGYQADLVSRHATYKPGEGITGRIFETAETVRSHSRAELEKQPGWTGKYDPLQKRQPNSFLGLPLRVSDRFTKATRTIGVLKVEEIQKQDAHPEEYFTEQDARLVGMMANVIATVVYNTQVSVAGLQDLTSDLARLSESVAGGKDRKALVRAVVQTTADVLGAQAASLYLYDESSRLLRIEASTGYQENLEREGADYKPGEGITGWIFQNEKPVLANSLEELRNHPAHKGKQDAKQGGKKPHAFYGVPLRVAERVIGVLKVEDISKSTRPPEEGFTAQDRALVDMMASVIAAVVYNTQLGEEQLKRFGANLQDLSEVLARSQEIGELVNKVVATIAGVLEAEAASVYLFDDATNQLVIKAATGYQRELVSRGATYVPGEGITGWIFKNRKNVLTSSLAQLTAHPAHKGKQDSNQGGRQPQAFCGVPLRVGEKVFGVLKVENIRRSANHPEERFTDQDVWLITMMANVIAAVVSVTREGEARIGKVLQRLGTLSTTTGNTRKLLAEYSQRTDEGSWDQMAIALAAYLDTLRQVDAETEALFRSRAHPGVYRRVVQRTKKEPVAFRMGVYSDVIHAYPNLKKWSLVNEKASLWFDLRAANASAQSFAAACRRIAAAMSAATGLTVLEQFLDKRKSWYCACFNTKESFGEQITSIPLFFPRQPEIDAAMLDSLETAIHEQLSTSPSIVQIMLWQPVRKRDALARLRQRLKVAGQDLVILERGEIIHIGASRSAIDEYRELTFRQASPPLLFTTEGWVPDFMFKGREKQLRAIMAQVRADRSCILSGGRKYGKTSILQRLLRVDLPRVGYPAVYLDARGIASDTMFLSEKLRLWHPSPPKNPPRTVGELLDKPPAKVVLLLDEPDALIAADRPNGWRLFNRIRARVNDKSLRVVLCGEKELRRTETEAGGPLYNFGQRIAVGPLERHEAESLVVEPFQFICVDLIDPDAVVDGIFRFTNGHPSLIQHICKRLVGRIDQKIAKDGPMRQVSVKDLDTVLEDVNFLDDPFLTVCWERADALEKVVAILMARNPEIRHANQIHAKVEERCGMELPLKDTRIALKDLITLRGILRHTTKGYEFALTSFPPVAQMEFVTSILDEEIAELRKRNG